MAGSLYQALRGVIAEDRSNPWILDGEIVLPGEARCAATQVRCRSPHFALRLHGVKGFGCLAQGLGRLPDYLLFSEPSRQGRRGPMPLQVVICEMKSSATGAREAMRQLQMGRLLCDYLLRVAAYTVKCAELKDAPDYRALVLSAELPIPPLLPKGGMNPRARTASDIDDVFHMPIEYRQGGEPLRLESLFG